MPSDRRPYTVLEPFQLHELAAEILRPNLAPGIASSALGVLEVHGREIFVPQGVYEAYHREGALRACYREQESDGVRQLAAVSKLRFEPVNGETTVRIG